MNFISEISGIKRIIIYYKIEENMSADFEIIVRFCIKIIYVIKFVFFRGVIVN